MREYVAVKPVPVTIGDQEYEILFSFGKLKQIREKLELDLLKTNEVGLDIFSKVLLMGLVDPKGLTEEKLESQIALPQLGYYLERLQLAIEGQIQPSQQTKNVSSASRPLTGSAKRKKKAERKSNSVSGAPQLVNGESLTQRSGA
jgi:hypothetical protein